MTELNQLDKMYHDDPAFHQVVDMMQMVITQLALTPGEVRAAAMYAAYRVECRTPHPVFLTRSDEVNFQAYFASVFKKK